MVAVETISLTLRPGPPCVMTYGMTVSLWVFDHTSSAESLSVLRSIICQRRITPTTAQTRVATRRVPDRLPGAAPLEHQLQSSASAPSSIPASDRTRQG